MINYPNKKNINDYVKSKNTANMGMALEEMINTSNDYYAAHDIAFVNKRPTPVKILKTADYYHITDAVFLSPSTLDYVGIYQGKYLDFEAKETTSKKGFPMSNIAPHQIAAMQKILLHGGITFAIIFLREYNEVYLIDGTIMIDHFNNKKTYLTYDEMKQLGNKVTEGYFLPVDYIKVVKEKYFK